LSPGAAALTDARSGKTVVTGGCGFIGARLCEHLVQAGEDVVVIDDLSLGVRQNIAAHSAAAVDVHPVDIRNVDAVSRLLRESRAEKVIHLAAVHFIPKCEADPVHAIRANVEGTQALLEACARAPSISSVVLASSGAVYRPDAKAHRESDSLGPTDVYGHTKRWSEELAALFRNRTGIPLAIARIFNTFGPGETNPHLIPSVILQLKRGRRVLAGRLTTRRDYVYVDDVAAALALLADSASQHELLVCNVGSGHAVEGTRVVELVARLLGHPVEIVVDESRLRTDDRPVLLSDCGVARTQLGWTAKTKLGEGLRAALERPIADEASFARQLAFGR
jgi:UDP-glucose 4-epimerase